MLDENGLKLSHLSYCIPPLLMQDKRKEKMCGELKGTFISCIFNGATHYGEVLAVVHFIKNWNIELCHVCLLLLAKYVMFAAK